MKTFLGHSRTLITAFLISNTEDGLLKEIENSIKEGADAMCFRMEILPKELRTEEKLTEFIAAMGDKPVYVTCYRRNDVIDETDEDRAEYLLRALKCGATMADIRGDMFAPCDGELTCDETAVARQKELISEIHSMGKEALMSTHLFYGDKIKFITKDEALRIATEQYRRGADIAKIVTNADDDDQLLENFETIVHLKRNLPIPCVFLCAGSKCVRHRIAGGLIYEPVVFARQSAYADDVSSVQPLIKTLVQVFKCAGYEM